MEIQVHTELFNNKALINLYKTCWLDVLPALQIFKIKFLLNSALFFRKTECYHLF